METRVFHGDITTEGLASALIARFNQGNLRAQKLGRGNKTVVQIGTRQRPASGGQTALTIRLETVEDGVSVHIGKQAWLGIAASLGTSALFALRNPWNILHRLDDIAQDIEHLQLSDEVWEVIENSALAAGASFELSERLRRLICDYCETANPIGEPSCIACGAPLGSVQPETCKNCGYVVEPDEKNCPNCGNKLF